MAVDIDGVNSTISTDKLIPQSGTALQIGESGDTVTLVGSAVGFGGGKILQAIKGTVKGDSFSSTSASFVDVTGVNATITPSATSSKILVMMNASIANGSADYATMVRVVTSTATEIFTGTSLGSRQSAFGGTGAPYGTNGMSNITSVFIHEPATTSALTYKLQVYCENAGTAWVGTNGTHGTGVRDLHTPTYINLMEIGA